MESSYPETCCAAREQEPVAADGGPLDWFADMVPHALDYAQAQQAQGHPIVGIMCEYAPREQHALEPSAIARTVATGYGRHAIAGAAETAHSA